MAGSNTWRTYITDQGDRYSIRVSEHTANGVGYGLSVANVLCPIRTASYPSLPTGFEPRIVYARPANSATVLKKVRSRAFVVGSRDVWLSIRTPNNAVEFFEGTQFNQSRFWVVTGYRGEREIIPPRYDVFG